MDQVAEVSDKFREFMKILLEKSVSQIFKEARLEWYCRFYEENLNRRCICTKCITRVYYMKNHINGNEIEVGSDCINKFPDERWQQEAKVAKSEVTRKTRDCETCGKRYPKDSHCPNCHGKVKCIGTCGKLIPENKYRPRCEKCYTAYMQSQELVKCQGVNCNKDIPKNKFKPLCKKCWWEKMRK